MKDLMMVRIMVNVIHQDAGDVETDGRCSGGRTYKNILAGRHSSIGSLIFKLIFQCDNSMRSMVEKFCISWKSPRDLIL